MNSARKNKTHRGSPRRSASAQVRVTCQKKGTEAGTGIVTAALDLSETGARLLVPMRLEPGEEIVLGIEGPAYETPLKLPGVVVWSIEVARGRYAVGVRLESQIGGDAVEQLTIPPARFDY
jgi:hypothetical protein